MINERAPWPAEAAGRFALQAAVMVLSVCSLAVTACARQPDPSPASHALGYGAEATGGLQPCHFSDEAHMRACLLRGGAVAIADQALTVAPGRSAIFVAPDTTLDGRGLLTIDAGYNGLMVQSRNVIVRDVIFRGPGPRETLYPELHPGANCTAPVLPKDLLGCATPLKITGGARDVWIDHNTFIRCGDKCLLGWTSNDETDRPDRVTVSNNIFRDNYFAAVFGVSARMATLPAPGHVTFYGNLFEHIFRRQPRAQGGYQIHVFNNYFEGPACSGVGGGFGPSVTGGGEMLLENNVAERGSCGAVIDDSDYSPLEGMARGYGRFRASGNAGLGGGRGRGDVDFAPAYVYRLIPTEEVRASVMANAGARRR